MTGSESTQDCYPAALRLLTGQDYTELALKEKLKARGFRAQEAQAATDRLVREGYLNDRRYAERFIASVRETGKFTGHRLFQELRRRGVPAELIDELLQEPPDEDDEFKKACALVSRRYGAFDAGSADDREVRRVAGFLQRRGYRTALISRLLDRRGAFRQV